VVVVGTDVVVVAPEVVVVGTEVVVVALEVVVVGTEVVVVAHPSSDSAILVQLEPQGLIESPPV